MYDEEELELYLKKELAEYRAEVSAYPKARKNQVHETEHSYRLSYGFNSSVVGERHGFSGGYDPEELDRYISAMEKDDISFQDKLKEYLRIKGMKDTDVYKSVGMSEKAFNKAKNDSKTSVSIDKTIMISLGLHLTLDEMLDMIERTGKVLKKSSKRNRIIKFFFETGDYDIDDLNDALFKKNEKTLGCVKDDKVPLIEM